MKPWFEFPEDIKVKPFIIKMSHKSFPVTTKASECKICQNIFVFDIDKSVERALIHYPVVPKVSLQHWRNYWRNKTIENYL
jgi:hypothetical protein